MADTNIIIRQIRMEDLESYRATFDTVARERQFMADWEAGPLDKMGRDLAAHLGAGLPLIVAADSDDIVGYCDLHRRSNQPVFAHCGQIDIAVRASHRGRGLGRLMLEAALAAGWDFGFRRIELYARADNHTAIALYEKLGFRHEGRLARDMMIDGVFHDGVIMAILSPD